MRKDKAGSAERTAASTAPPATPDVKARLAHAVAAHKQGQFSAARAGYEEILRQHPAHFDALHLLGLIAVQQGEHETGVDLIRRAIEINPRHASAHANLGSGLVHLKRLDEALASFDRALALKPDFAEAHNNRAAILQDLGRTVEALAGCERAIALRPDYAEAWNNRGNTLRSLRRPDEAFASYDRAIALMPDFAEAYNNRGAALQRLGRADEALADCERAVALKPDLAEAHNNRGAALQELGRADEALASCERAIALQPDFAEAHNNRGNVFVSLNRPQEALSSFATAIASKPDFAEGHWSEGLCRLLMGDLEIGWRKFEWRWRVATLDTPRYGFRQPLWQGKEPLEGKTILLHAEQGLGDTLQFVRYAPLVAGLGARVLLLVQPPLKTLLAGMHGVAEVHAGIESLPAFDCYCPLMSLPLAFATELSTIPGAAPYLRADPACALRWHERLGGAEPRVGLVWAGSAREHDPHAHRVDRRRSMTLAQFAPLARVRGVRFVSLQKGPPSEQLQQQPSGMAIADYTAELLDFTDTAALVSVLDLVITVDTSVAHLAGGMGKPVWILSRFDGCWRWLLDREDSPWYPSARIFRQHAPGDWDDVMERVAGALHRWRQGALPVPPATAAHGEADD